MTIASWLSLQVSARPRTWFLLYWVIVVALLAGAIASRPGQVLNLDLLSMVDLADADPFIGLARDRARHDIERDHLWVLSHPDREQALRHGQELVARLERSALLSVADDGPGPGLPQIREFYAGFRYQLLGDRERSWLSQLDSASVADQVLNELHLQPFGSMLMRLGDDPALLLGGYLKALGSQYPDALLLNGMAVFAREGQTHVLIRTRLEASPFDTAYQDSIAGLFEDLARRAAQDGAQVRSMGVLSHALEARRIGEREARIIGGVSLLAILLLIGFTFGQTIPLLAVLMTIASGVAVGFAVCLAAFGTIHIITLVGGTSLISIAADYAFHLLADRFRKPDGWQVHEGLTATLPTIFLGLLTSVLGFFGLFMSGFKGLQEIAVFSIFGLIGAFASLLFCYPALLGGHVPPLKRVIAVQVADRWRRVSGSAGFRWIVILAAAAGLGTLYLSWHELRAVDDVRSLSIQRSEAAGTQQAIQQIVGRHPDSRFLLVRAESSQGLLEREEALRDVLRPFREQGLLERYSMLSEYVPSHRRQAADHALVRARMSGADNVLDVLADRLGLVPEAVADYRSGLSEQRPSRWLELEEWLETPMGSLLRSHWLGEAGDETGSIVTLEGIGDITALGAAVAPLDGVHLVDTVADISGLLRDYREHAQGALVFVFIAVFSVMVVRFGWRSGSIIMLTPVVAGLCTLSLLVVLGEGINLFHVVAMAVVFGMGMDYVLFLRKGAEKGDDASGTAAVIAVLLATLTTQLAFGLLGLSQLGSIHSFGMTVAVGIAVSFIIAPVIVGFLKPSAVAGR